MTFGIHGNETRLLWEPFCRRKCRHVQLSWLELLWTFAAIALNSFTYIALPSRFHFIKPEWQDAAFIVMMTSVIIVIACQKIFWRNFVFWVSLLISSTIHVVVVHALTRRVPNLSRSAAKGAAVLGFLLFLAVYGVLRLLQRMFNSEEIRTAPSGDRHVPG